MNFLPSVRQTFFTNWYPVNFNLMFVLICLMYGLIHYLSRIFIISDIAAFTVLEMRGEMWLFDAIYALSYLSTPIFLLWKFTLTAFLLYTGCFLFGYNLTYRSLWQWVMVSEVIFIAPALIKFVWLLFSSKDLSYFDLQAFYPLSLMQLVNYADIPNMFHYPLKALNVFEVIYWFLLVFGIYGLSQKSWKTSLIICFTSYVLFFFIWIGYYLLVYK